MKLDDFLTGEERETAAWRSRLAARLIALLALAAFWFGLQYLDERVFYHRFNPSRHAIVNQDPDTYEIYAWRDAFGRVYTPADPHVRYFPYAAGALALLFLGASVSLYHLLAQHYKMQLLIRNWWLKE